MSIETLPNIIKYHEYINDKYHFIIGVEHGKDDKIVNAVYIKNIKYDPSYQMTVFGTSLSVLFEVLEKSGYFLPALSDPNNTPVT